MNISNLGSVKFLYAITFTFMFMHSIEAIFGVYGHDTEMLVKGIRGLIINTLFLGLFLHLRGQLFTSDKDKEE